MTREEAIEKVRQMILPKETMEILEALAPELKESKYEKIRKFLINLVSTMNWRKDWPEDKVKEEKVECLAWLEKQKEPVPIPDKFSGLKSLMLQYLQSAANRKDDSEIESDTDLWGRKILDYVWKYSDEQKPNIELIQRSWYMEGYHDREFGKEPKWIIKTGDGGPKHEINPRYGQPLTEQQVTEEQKPIKWTDLTWKDIVELEGIINNVHYEFHNGIGQESFGKEVLEKFREYKGDEYLDEVEQKPVEWSEEEKKFIKHCAELLDGQGEPMCALRLESLCPQKLDVSKLENYDLVEVLNKIKTEWPMAWEKVVGEQEWSEEDETILEQFLGWLEGAMGEKTYSSWLKSLCERFNSKKCNKEMDLDTKLQDRLEEISRNGLENAHTIDFSKEYENSKQILEKSSNSTEWSEKDEKMIERLITRLNWITYNTRTDGTSPNITFFDEIDWLKSLRLQLKDAYKDGFQTARHATALTFMNYLDENRPEGKMSLSNGECEDIDKAFKENDWAKIIRYVEKYRPSWKPSEDEESKKK